MKCHPEMFKRWKKYVTLYLSERGTREEDVCEPSLAWTIANRLDIPREAYHVGLTDTHIETALRKLFVNYGKKR